jgi:hypothetical protein
VAAETDHASTPSDRRVSECGQSVVSNTVLFPEEFPVDSQKQVASAFLQTIGHAYNMHARAVSGPKTT